MNISSLDVLGSCCWEKGMELRDETGGIWDWMELLWEQRERYFVTSGIRICGRGLFWVASHLRTAGRHACFQTLLRRRSWSEKKVTILKERKECIAGDALSCVCEVGDALSNRSEEDWVVWKIWNDVVLCSFWDENRYLLLAEKRGVKDCGKQRSAKKEGGSELLRAEEKRREMVEERRGLCAGCE